MCELRGDDKREEKCRHTHYNAALVSTKQHLPPLFSPNFEVLL